MSKAGRPKLPDEEKAKPWILKWRPELLARLRRLVARGKWSEYVQDATEKALDAEERAKKGKK